MANWVKCARASDLSEGTMCGVQVGEQPICLSHVNGKFYAISDICSHAEALLSDGTLMGNCVECPLHGAQFDVTTGAVKQLPATEPVASYPVKVEDNEIYVDIGD